MKDYTDKDFISQIIKAINDDSLIVFVGAGVSALFGLPLWGDLADELLKICAEDEKCLFDYKALERIKSKIRDSREKISIAYSLLKNAYGNSDMFFNLLKEKLHFDSYESEKYIRIVSALFRITNTIITTNADSSLDHGLEDNHILYKLDGEIDSFYPSSERRIVHIHGSINGRCEDLVFTTRNYLERYNKKSFRNMLKKLISDNKYTFIFAGYSFSEMQLLDFLVNVKDKDERIKRMYRLEGYFSEEEDLFSAESDYYQEYGVTLISYSRDKKDYDGLIDALEYIAFKSGDSTFKNTNSLSYLIEIIQSGFSNSKISRFENDFLKLTYDGQVYLLDELSKSKDATKWVKAIVRSDKISDFLFNVEKQPVFKKNKENGVDRVPYIGINLFNRVSISGEKIYDDFLKNFIKKVCEIINKNPEFYSNDLLCKGLLKLGFSNEKYLTSEYMKFVSNFSNYSGKSDKNIWILFMYYQNDILTKCAKKSALSLFEWSIRDLLSDDSDYYYIGFFNEYSDYYSEKYPYECFEILLKYYKPSSYDDFSSDAFEVIKNAKISDMDPVNITKKYIIKCVKNFDEDYLLEIFEECINGGIFKKRLAIFIANSFYKRIRQEFWSNIRLFLPRDFYAEIYSLIKNNENTIVLFNDEEKVLEYISGIDYDTEFWTKACKLDILELLNKSTKNSELRLLHSTIKMSFSEEEWSMYRNFYDPLNRSKHVWIGPINEYLGDDSFNKKLLNADSRELYSVIKEAEGNYDKIYSVKKNIKEIVKNNDYYKYILNNIDEMIPLPDYFVEPLLQNIYSLDVDAKEKTSLIMLLDKKTDYKFNDIALSNLYFILSNNKNMDLSYVNDEFVEYLKNAKEEQYDFSNVNNRIDFNWLVHKKTYQKYYLLIICSKIYLELKKYVINELNNGDEEKKALIKATIASALDCFYLPNNTWIIDNVSTIFDNYVCNTNLSFIGFQLSQILEKTFVHKLKDTGYLEKIINSKEFSRFSSGYISHVLYLYLNENMGIEEVITCLKSESSLVGFGYLVDYLVSNNTDFEKREKIETMIENMIKNVSRYKDNCCYEGIKFINLYNYVDNKKLLIGLCKKLLSKTNSVFHTEEMIKNLSKNNLKLSDKKQLIKSFVLHLDEHYFNVEEVCSLINSVYWSEMEFEKIMTKLSNTNPDYAIRLKKGRRPKRKKTK